MAMTHMRSTLKQTQSHMSKQTNKNSCRLGQTTLGCDSALHAAVDTTLCLRFPAPVLKRKTSRGLIGIHMPAGFGRLKDHDVVGFCLFAGSPERIFVFCICSFPPVGSKGNLSHSWTYFVF